MPSSASQEVGPAMSEPVATPPAVVIDTSLEYPTNITAPMAPNKVQSPIDTLVVDPKITSISGCSFMLKITVSPDSALSSRPDTPHSRMSTGEPDTSSESDASSEADDNEVTLSPQSSIHSSSDSDKIPEIVLPPASQELYRHLQQRRKGSTLVDETWSYHNSPTLQPSSDQSSQSCPSSPPLDSVKHDAATSQATNPTSHGVNPFGPTTSRASQEWIFRKLLDGETNQVLDMLMQYQGLEEVKQQFLDIKSKVDCCRDQGRDLKSERFNIVFQGNPGTGKTTIARLYANFLHSLGILGSNHVQEMSGIKVTTKGAVGIQQELDTLLIMGGGVLFVDEAYQLTAPYVDGVGRPALDIILSAMENNIGKLVVIFVGYKDEMVSFFEHNPGLSSRIPYTMNFTDFSDGELWKILCDNITKQYGGRMQIEGGMDGLYMRIAIRRLAQVRGSRSFGNARAVENLLARISQRQAQRLTKEKRYNRKQNYLLFKKEDLIGPDPATAAHNSEAWAQLHKLIGLDQVKECVKSMIGMMRLNYRRELRERPPLKFSLNQLFVGNPGTGKTTAARLYGRILADLGYLSHGDLVLKTPADFIGECLGKSEAKTRKVLEATVGKILVIDEAYMLDAGDPDKDQDKFKTGVIDTLVSMVQGVPAEDRCIVLIGYENKIRNMFHNVNPGLSRRFPIERPFRFENFDLPQLEKILRLKMNEQKLEYTDHSIRVACEVLERSLMRPNFTNAGEVDSLLSTAKMNYEMRLSKMSPESLDIDIEVVAADFDPNHDRGSQLDCRKLMEGLVHSTITDKLVGYQKQYFGAKSLGINPRDQVPTRFIFKGPPGTGKTTTAQKMGEIFYRMGFLATPEVVECSAADLLGQYVGHTVPKTRKKLQEGIGRVLFIDEAYRLIYGQYAAEAVDELAQFLGQKENEGKMVVILAGYPADVQLLMSTRPNIGGLFPEDIIFNNIPPGDCIALLAKEFELSNFTSEAGFLTDSGSPDYVKVKRLFNAMQLIPGWSNARDVRNLSKRIVGKFLEHTNDSTNKSTNNQLHILSAEHITNCMREMITQQRDRCIVTGANDNVYMPQQPPMRANSNHGLLNPQLASPPPLTSTDIRTPGTGNAYSATNSGASTGTRIQDQTHSSMSQVNAVYTQTNRTRVDRNIQGGSPESANMREGGVSEDIWQELLKAKKIENAQHNQRKTEIEKLQRALQEAESDTSGGTGGRGNDTDCDAIRDQLSAIQQRMQDEERVQAAIGEMNRCVNGFAWHRVAGGYRCDGGMHLVTDMEVQSRLV
ncbi:P-loop containing nucleoside triphosphate hydrolase protein [Annulohypoxylon truncatum]|uniref:P-loop containing nucleoside triphosphate hydrolase protein n=1 Tax=Annulohypoxylon truncatum TaxID=327061 RepID=UPI002007FDE3|nr:P-loop containing nucleoside triphosphate hydrolase protein [Annulohypoxylon truncatum]KAI1207185.1 P-loop containing nucleoside triphosphate hydrolase protein [Annulohypoxylon truncatum]